MESFYESLDYRPLGRPGDTSQNKNKTPPREPQFRATVSSPSSRAKSERARDRAGAGAGARARDQRTPAETEQHSLFTAVAAIASKHCVYAGWHVEDLCEHLRLRSLEDLDGHLRLGSLHHLRRHHPFRSRTCRLVLLKAGPDHLFRRRKPVLVTGSHSAATTRTFSALPPIPALPTLPALPGFFSSTPSSSAPNTDGPPGIHLLDNSTRVLQVPLELGVLVSGTGVSFEVSTSHTRFLIDTLSDDFGQEKPLLNFEVQKVSDSWNSAQKRWEIAKRTWETEMSGFFFNFSWESDQLFALADMWDMTDKQQAAARDSLEDSSSTVSSFLLKLRRQLFRGAADGKTRPQSVKASQSVVRLRGTVERQVDMSEVFLKDLREIHGHMSESQSVSCDAGSFLLSRQQTTGETTTGVRAVSGDNVSLSQASDSMYAFCKTMETSIIEIDDLISKVGEDVDMLKKIGWSLLKGFNSLIISMEAKKDSLVKDGGEHAESEKLVRIGVVKIHARLLIATQKYK